jgi:hypothetical protein
MPKIFKVGFKVGISIILLFLLAEGVQASLNVPRFSQLDGRWAKNRLGTSNFNISNYGCALTSKAMTFNFYQRNWTDPARLNRYLINHGGYSGSCLMRWNNVGVPAGVSYQGNFSNRNLTKQKINHYPLIAQVYKSRIPMHFVVLTGRHNNDYLINDPWGGIKTTLNNRRYHLQRCHLYARTGGGTRVSVTKPSLRIVQGLWLKRYDKAFAGEPFDAQFTVKNFSARKITVKNFTIWVRGPQNQNLDFRGTGKVVLKPKKSYRLFRKTAHLGRRGMVGFYRFGCSYQDLKGKWHLLVCGSRGTVNQRKLKVVNRPISQTNPPVEKLIQIRDDFDNEDKIEIKNQIQISGGEARLDSWQKNFQIETKADFLKGNFNGLYFDNEKQGVRIENPTIKILQIYPPGHNQELLRQIIDRYAPDPRVFEVSSVSVRNFNQKKFDDGKTLDLNPFNLLYFGVADVYGSNPPHWINDLNATGESLVRQFHAQGKGIVFTHDTLGAGDPCWLQHNYFNRLKDITGITTDTSLGKWKEFRAVQLNQSIAPDHPMLNYPFSIPDSFPVIHTHRLYQKVIAGDVFAFGPSSSDLYWQAFKNSTFFSYGNVEQIPLEWEGKALINTLSNTYQGGSYLSPIFDSQSGQGKVSVDFVIEENSSLTEFEFSLRFGNSLLVDNNWTNWITVENSQKVTKQGRFLQYQVKLKSANLALSPLLKSVSLSCDSLFYSQGLVTSVAFQPEGITRWSHFDFVGDPRGQEIKFDLINAETNKVLIADLNKNQDLTKIDSSLPLRVKISFATNNLLESPELDQWVIFYRK